MDFITDSEKKNVISICWSNSEKKTHHCKEDWRQSEWEKKKLFILPKGSQGEWRQKKTHNMFNFSPKPFYVQFHIRFLALVLSSSLQIPILYSIELKIIISGLMERNGYNKWENKKKVLYAIRIFSPKLIIFIFQKGRWKDDTRKKSCVCSIRSEVKKWGWLVCIQWKGWHEQWTGGIKRKRLRPTKWTCIQRIEFVYYPLLDLHTIQRSLKEICST